MSLTRLMSASQSVRITWRPIEPRLLPATHTVKRSAAAAAVMYCPRGAVTTGPEAPSSSSGKTSASQLAAAQGGCKPLQVINTLQLFKGFRLTAVVRFYYQSIVPSATFQGFACHLRNTGLGRKNKMESTS